MYYYLFIYGNAACRMLFPRISVPQPIMEPRSTAVKVSSFNHWTIRECSSSHLCNHLFDLTFALINGLCLHLIYIEQNMNVDLLFVSSFLAVGFRAAP